CEGIQKQTPKQKLTRLLNKEKKSARKTPPRFNQPRTHQEKTPAGSERTGNQKTTLKSSTNTLLSSQTTTTHKPIRKPTIRRKPEPLSGSE
ncbi:MULTISPECIES: hypothetical protein, partial [unclassified Bifidobacterium]|uniref:hypothetical protein n=1 Tax=unclassified Bifidobacterium TaxID=2608897 RepID=UPI001C616512